MPKQVSPNVSLQVRRAAFGCLYELFRRDPTGPFMPHWRRAQLQRFVESLWKYQPASSDHSDAALWLKAFAEAQVLAAKERASSEGMLIETLETCIELSTRRSKLLGRHFVLGQKVVLESGHSAK